MLKVQQMQENLEQYHLHYEEDDFDKKYDIQNLFRRLYMTENARGYNTLFFAFDEKENKIIKPSEYATNKQFQNLLAKITHYEKIIKDNRGIYSINFDNERIAFIRIIFRWYETFPIGKYKQYIQFAYLTPKSISRYAINEINFEFRYRTGKSDLDTLSNHLSQMFLYYPDTKTVKSMEYYVRRDGSKKTYLTDLSIIDNLDFTDDLELLSKMSDDFLFCKEFHNEQVGHTTLTYSDVLQGGNTKKNILLNKWKSLNKLNGLINFNKYTVDELTMLRQMQGKITKNDFIKTLNWYTNSKWHKDENYRAKNFWFDDLMDRQYCWQLIYFEANFKNALHGRLYPDFNNKTDDANTINKVRQAFTSFRDYLNLFKKIYPYKKIHISFTSFKRLNEEELHLSKINEQKRYDKLHKPFYKDKKWDKLKLNIINSDLNITLLDNVDKLVAEGNEQHNCIGDLYVEPAYNNQCVILDYIDEKKNRYSIEVRYNSKNKKYYIEQCYLKYNEIGDESVPKKIEKILNKDRQ